MTFRRCMTLPLGGDAHKGVKVDERTGGGAVEYLVYGYGTVRSFNNPVEAFDHALMVMGWNAQVTERYKDGDAD